MPHRPQARFPEPHRQQESHNSIPVLGGLRAGSLYPTGPRAAYQCSTGFQCPWGRIPVPHRAGQDPNVQREELHPHRAQDPSAPRRDPCDGRAGSQGNISVLRAGFEFLTSPVPLGQDPSALGSIPTSPARQFGRGWPCPCTCDPSNLARTELHHQCLRALRDPSVPLLAAPVPHSPSFPTLR